MLTGIQFIDVCYVDYLTDHHTREGECLIGVPVSRRGRKPERSVEMFIAEVNGADWGIPDDITTDELAREFRTCIGDWRLADSGAPGRRSQEVLCAWFLISWGEQPEECDTYDPEGEQLAWSAELTLDSLAELREEWSDNF